MSALWYLDRGSGLVAFGALWLASLTGILYNARPLGGWQRWSFRVHTPVSVVAAVALLLHTGVGIVDSWGVLRGWVPTPAYGNGYLVLGDFVGLCALVILVTSILAMVDPKKFERPWDPKAVHAFAYAGFVFSAFHALAIGSDVTLLNRYVVVALCAALLVVLVVRFVSAHVAGQARPG